MEPLGDDTGEALRARRVHQRHAGARVGRRCLPRGSRERQCLERLGIVELPPEMLALLRYGRGVDNRRLKRAGFEYRYTSAGAVENFARAMHLRKTVGDSRPAYRYDTEVETFFRHSPAVVRTPD